MLKTLAIVLLASFAHSQPAFDVASIKPIPPANATASPLLEKVNAHPGSVSMSSVRIRTCIKWAYDLKNYEIEGVDGLAPERYNIMAKADEATPVPKLRIMMQTLLQSRFGLTFHRETKQVSAFELKGRFDFSLDATPSGPPSNPDPRYAFADAAEKQLGLKLVATKTSVEILIVDHVENVPTEN